MQPAHRVALRRDAIPAENLKANVYIFNPYDKNFLRVRERFLLGRCEFLLE